MAHTYRFFAEKKSQGLWLLEDDEVVHALKVLRLADGETVEVMDGKGVTGVGTLHVESKSKVSVCDVEEACHAKDPWTRSVLVGALKQGDIDDLIAPMVELGVDRILVYRQDDTPKFRVSDNSSERWQRLVRSAMKQSKRPWLVTVEAFDSLELAMSDVSTCQFRWMLSPDASSDFMDIIDEVKSASGGGMAALIGGEKGFSVREESAAIRAGFTPIRLGPWVLRARTATAAVAVFLGMLPRKS